MVAYKCFSTRRVDRGRFRHTLYTPLALDLCASVTSVACVRAGAVVAYRRISGGWFESGSIRRQVATLGKSFTPTCSVGRND